VGRGVGKWSGSFGTTQSAGIGVKWPGLSSQKICVGDAPDTPNAPELPAVARSSRAPAHPASTTEIATEIATNPTAPTRLDLARFGCALMAPLPNTSTS
jgi:hypothetical protein